MALITQTGQQYYNSASPTPFGNYQFTSLNNIIEHFMFVYTGEGKLIPKISRTDVQFHAMRGLQELSFDTFKSCKTQEIVVPASLRMTLPQDYVNYVKLTWSDSAGVEHIIYPTSKTSNPTQVQQDAAGAYQLDGTALDTDTTSTTWANYQTATPNENEDRYDDEEDELAAGQRYGIDPQYAQTNGSFHISCNRGLIHFSSNIAGKTVILEYISDSLGSAEEMKVHKFAEEALYKWIMYGILSVRSNVPEYVINRYKKERFAETRKAKIRLSNIKIEEITQILRGKSKWIKH